jgi:hypothetical protein
MRKGMPFPTIIRGKSELSADHTGERYAFTQHNTQKAQTFLGMIRGKVRSFHGLSCRKACLGAVKYAESSVFLQIIRGKFPLFHEYLSQIKTKFEFIVRCSSGAYEVLIDDKPEPQNLMLQSL